MKQMTARGQNIEEKSFAIIDREAGPHSYSKEEWQVVRRAIHSTADFEFQSILKFHPQAIESGVSALRRGCGILVDVKMISAGLSEERLSACGCSVNSYISDPDVISLAKERNSTRAIEAMRKAHRLGRLSGSIVAIGNAPTALLEVTRLVNEEAAKPALIVGVPVGFVSAAESKEAVTRLSFPWIVSEGRKGGSTVAVAILHALLGLEAVSGKVS